MSNTESRKTQLRRFREELPKAFYTPSLEKTLQILKMDVTQLRKVQSAQTVENILFEPNAEVFLASMVRATELNDFQMMKSFLRHATQTDTLLIAAHLFAFEHHPDFDFKELLSLIDESQHGLIMTKVPYFCSETFEYHKYLPYLSEAQLKVYLEVVDGNKLKDLLVNAPEVVKGQEMSARVRCKFIDVSTVNALLQAQVKVSPYALRVHLFRCIESNNLEYAREAAQFPQCQTLSTLSDGWFRDGVSLDPSQSPFNLSQEQRYELDTLYASGVKSLQTSFDIDSFFHLTDTEVAHIELTMAFVSMHCEVIKHCCRETTNETVRKFMDEITSQQQLLGPEDYVQSQFLTLDFSETRRKLSDLCMLTSVVVNSHHSEQPKLFSAEYNILRTACNSLHEDAVEADELLYDLVTRPFTPAQLQTLLKMTEHGLLSSVDQIDTLLETDEIQPSARRL